MTSVEIPESGTVEIAVSGKRLALSNLDKLFWRDIGITKGDLLRYYLSVSPYLLPHIRKRPMVMKRYPNGAYAEHFFMKRAPVPRPAWVRTCSIEHDSGNVIDFPLINDIPSLLWLVNLGCIDLNPWYARCDDVMRPDYLHFDLDPTPGAAFSLVREAALVLRSALEKLGMRSYPKTTGSRGIHIYVPIIRGPVQKEVWKAAKMIAAAVSDAHPSLMTAEYRIAKRPRNRILIDYNQNAWGRTLASVYSVRPRKDAPVSMPVTYREIEAGVTIERFTISNALKRLERSGDLWKPLLEAAGRCNLKKYVR